MGEVYGSPRNYNRARAVLGLKYNHTCGTPEEWRDGERYDPARPPAIYDGNHLPLCCRPPVAVAGGAIGSGSALISKTYRDRGTGGALGSGSAIVYVHGELVGTGGGIGSGTAIDQAYFTNTGSGGGIGSGSALVALVAHEIGTGGALGSGSALVALVAHEIGTGGGIGSGAATVAGVANLVGSGGGIGSGSALVAGVAHYVGTGGGIGSGSALVALVAHEIGTGGALGSGSASVALVAHLVGTGGGIGSGSGIVVVIPPAPTPGTSCSSAPTLTLGTTYGPFTQPTFTANWFAFEAVLGTTYNVKFVPTAHPVALVGEQGTCPSALIPLFTTNPVAGCWQFTAISTGLCWFNVGNSSGSTQIYSVTIGSGVC